MDQPVLIWHHTDLPGDLEETVAHTQDPSWVAYFHPSLDPDDFAFIDAMSTFAPYGLKWFKSSYGCLAVACLGLEQTPPAAKPDAFEVPLADQYSSCVWIYGAAPPYAARVIDNRPGAWVAEVPNHVLVGYDIPWLEDGSEFAFNDLAVYPQETGNTLFVGSV